MRHIKLMKPSWRQVENAWFCPGNYQSTRKRREQLSETPNNSLFQNRLVKIRDKLTYKQLCSCRKEAARCLYLSVVSVIASIVQYLERSFFIIISYFDFKFASTYNLILFCCLRRNVELCSHTHDSRTTMNVYSARPRLVSLALYSHGQPWLCTARRAWSSNTRSKQKAGRKVQNTNQGAAVISNSN